VKPYYPEAFQICDLGPYDERIDLKLTQRGGLLSLQPHFTPQLWRLSRPVTRFGRKYHRELKKATHIAAYLYANLVHVETTEGRRHLTRLTFRTLSGVTFVAQAKHYVLACGGLENPRLLLFFGLGGRNVGRFFMEHPCINHACQLMLFDQKPLDVFYSRHLRGFYTRHLRGKLFLLGNISLTVATQEEYRLLNTAFKVTEKVRITGPVATSIRHFSERLLAPVPFQHVYSLKCRPEPVPNPESRVTLGVKKDVLGVPHVVLNWQLTDMDLLNLRRVCRLLASTVAANGVGRVRYADWLFKPVREWPAYILTGGNHHMGTTRMADGIETGVVDKDCRVFGVDNLYVAGSSVFPTGSWGNPTMNIVAFALRLADHLKSKS
jgi:choline dehydrogenase-like flavoprotein